MSQQGLGITDAERRAKQIFALAVPANPEIEACIQPVSHPEKRLIFCQPQANPLPSEKERLMADGNDSVRFGIWLDVKQAFFYERIYEIFCAFLLPAVELSR